jgi:hypothetical protein
VEGAQGNQACGGKGPVNLDIEGWLRISVRLYEEFRKTMYALIMQKEKIKHWSRLAGRKDLYRDRNRKSIKSPTT